jgi:hypothetical protein
MSIPDIQFGPDGKYGDSMHRMDEVHCNTGLPEDETLVNALREQVMGIINENVTCYEVSFAGYPELQRIWCPESKQIIATGIAESLIMLDLIDIPLPNFLIWRQQHVEQLNLPKSIMWISYDTEGEIHWNINYDRVYEESRKFGTNMEPYAKLTLRRATAHETHHIWDIINFQERAARSGLINSTTTITFCDPGEAQADRFAYHYNELCVEREEK